MIDTDSNTKTDRAASPAPAEPTVFPDVIKQRLQSRALELGFALCRIAPATRPPHGDDFLEWLADGMAGEMATWLERSKERRTDPELVLPGVKSVVVLALNYFHSPIPDAELTQDRGPRGQFAMYAHGDDYHLLVEPKLKELDQFLQQFGAKQRYYVDTGPVLERDFAAEAGLGWQSKSTMVLHPKLGTWFFLAEVLTTLELPPDQALRKSHCGSCTRCLDACPTQAIRHDRPYHLDARRCISYLTIEHRGPIPEEFRRAIGGRVYGCDACLEVCPWNKFASASHDAALQMRTELAELTLRDILELTEEDFRRIFRRSPIKRVKLHGLIRNACVALGNVGTLDDIPALKKVIENQSDPIVVSHAEWALCEIQQRLGSHSEAAPALGLGAAIG